MLKKVHTIQYLFKAILTVLAVSGLFFATSAFALEVNIASMVQNFSKTVPNLMRLVTAVAYVIGFFFIVKGVIGLKHFGESRTMQSSHSDLIGPLMSLLAGTALVYLPSSVQAGIGTFWINTSPLAYQPSTQDNWTAFMQNMFMILQLIGTFAFIRGLIMLTHVGGHGAQQGTFARAITHIIGGVFLINMYQFIQTITNTLALGQF